MKPGGGRGGRRQDKRIFEEETDRQTETERGRQGPERERDRPKTETASGGDLTPPSLPHAMNSTTPPPSVGGGDAAVGYVLVPLFLLTIVGIAAAVVMYIRKKRRMDRLRHQLLPVYTYDPSEEVNEAEQEMLWREEDTKVVQSWARSYQQRRPLLTEDVHA